MGWQKDGGPAFPCLREYGGEHDGMSLRDYFAAKAMQAMVQVALSARGLDGSKINAHVTEAAYEIADAMLAERRGAAAKDT